VSFLLERLRITPTDELSRRKFHTTTPPQNTQRIINTATIFSGSLSEKTRINNIAARPIDPKTCDDVEVLLVDVCGTP